MLLICLVFCVMFLFRILWKYCLCLLSLSPVLSCGVRVVYFVIFCVFTFLVPCCGVRYDFHIKRCSIRLSQWLIGWLIILLCLFTYIGVLHVVLSYVFPFSIQCCDGHYDFAYKWCSVRLYSQIFVGELMSYLLFEFVCVVSNTSDKRQELLTLREHLGSLPVCWWGLCCSSLKFFVLFLFFSFCFVYLCVLCSQCLWIVHS